MSNNPLFLEPVRPEFVTITLAYQGKTVQAQVTDTVAQDEDCIGRFVTARMTPQLMR